MSQSQSSQSAEPSPARKRRSGTVLAAFLFGVPLAVAVLGAHHQGLLNDTPIHRYLHHPVEQVVVLLFCGAVGVLAGKFLAYLGERAACRRVSLPPWDGKPVPVATATELQAEVHRLPRRWQDTFLVNRVHAILDFLRRRGSAAELDDHMRSLADNDSLLVEESYALTRFITWAIPILGFLGTVLGITSAIAGVTPEKLESNLNGVTDGLALAFDATALALSLTMVVMFLTYLVERCEQGVLQTVDQFADRHLAHRFERPSSGGGELAEVVRQNSAVLLGTMEKLVQGQAKVWARSLEEVDRRRSEVEDRWQQRLTAALETALEHTLEAHSRRLTALELQTAQQQTQLLEQVQELTATVRASGQEQQGLLVPVARSLAEQTQALARVQEGGKQLLQLQEALQQNLTVLAGTGAFEEAVHSLTAAIHLLTTRSSAPSGPVTARAIPRPGAAA